MKTIQPSFAAGELSPSLWARVDLAKYRIGARTLRNMIVHPHGGASNRPGTQFVYEIPGNARLIPFEFSVTQAYVLVFSNNEMRILKDGGLVVYPPGHPDEGDVVVIASPYAFADLALLRFTQSFDTLFLAHPSYQPRLLTRTDHHEWTFSLQTVVPSIPAPTGLAASPAYGTQASYTYQIFTYNGANVGATGSAQIAVTAPDTWSGSVALAWAAVGGATSYLIYRKKNVGAYVFQAEVSGTLWTDVNSPGTDPGYASAAVTAPGNVTATYVPPAGYRDYTYCVSQVNGDESYPSSVVTAKVPDPWTAGSRVVLSWSAATGAQEYNVYKNSRGQWGWIGSTTSTSFVDDNIDPDVSYGLRKEPINEFDAADNYPGAVALYQQRLCLARTNEEPSNIWASRTGSLTDFSLSDPLRTDDPISARPASGRGDEIKHLVPLDALLVFTAGGEFTMAGSDGSLKASNVEFKFQSYYGSSDVAPLVVGKSVLFLDRAGRKVRDFLFQLEFDSYTGNDMSVMASHLTESATIVDWAYAADPDGVVWTVRSDGAFLGFTYLREHQVFAWTRHDTDGLVKAVASIPEGTSNTVYFVAQRTIGGAAKYYIEKLAPRVADGGVFMDSAVSYSGALITVCTGLSHLNGKEVIVLSDKNVVRGLTVSGGQITLPRAATSVHVGLPYTSEVETLDLDLSGQDSNQGRKQKVSGVVVRFRESRGGVFVGPDEANSYEIPFRAFEGYSEPTEVFTGDKEISISPAWGRGAKVYIKQTAPLPLTVLAIIPEVSVGG